MERLPDLIQEEIANALSETNSFTLELRLVSKGWDDMWAPTYFSRLNYIVERGSLEWSQELFVRYGKYIKYFTINMGFFDPGSLAFDRREAYLNPQAAHANDLAVVEHLGNIVGLLPNVTDFNIHFGTTAQVNTFRPMFRHVRRVNFLGVTRDALSSFNFNGEFPSSIDTVDGRTVAWDALA